MSLSQQFIQALNSQNHGKIKELLKKMDAQAINEACTRHRETPLHVACRTNNGEVVRKLLAIPGVNPNAKTTYGWTPVMTSAARCTSEALGVLLEDPRVSLDASDDDGEGLEDVIGMSGVNLLEKSKCLEMIKEAKRHRGNGNGNLETEISLEDIRTNVRKQYLEKIDKINLQINEKKKKISYNKELKNTKIKNLEIKQEFQKETLAKESIKKERKLKQEKLQLEQSLAELQQRLANTNNLLASMYMINSWNDEGMKKRHENEKKTLEAIYEEDVKEDQQHLSKLMEIANQLSSDLRKIDMDSDNTSSNLEAARDTLECPVCMDTMRPPVHIWMCPSSHLVCEPCKKKVEGRPCPTCRTERVTLRAFFAENIAATLFNN